MRQDYKVKQSGMCFMYHCAGYRPMGSQSSSGMSGRGSSGNPDQSEPEPETNQNSNQRGRRPAERQAERQSAAEEDVDLAQVLAYLLRRYIVCISYTWWSVRFYQDRDLIFALRRIIFQYTLQTSAFKGSVLLMTFREFSCNYSVCLLPLVPLDL